MALVNTLTNTKKSPGGRAGGWREVSFWIDLFPKVVEASWTSSSGIEFPPRRLIGAKADRVSIRLMRESGHTEEDPG
ncbi:MAG: hypothetical protein BGO01_08725 [Armatimonadetes bacterium 55-13]|nr:MAG: hypothetical protein BGO01_08725 [Armatimonadetes bacterium 55-13]